MRGGPSCVSNSDEVLISDLRSLNRLRFAPALAEDDRVDPVDIGIVDAVDGMLDQNQATPARSLAKRGRDPVNRSFHIIWRSTVPQCGRGTHLVNLGVCRNVRTCVLQGVHHDFFHRDQMTAAVRIGYTVSLQKFGKPVLQARQIRQAIRRRLSLPNSFYQHLAFSTVAPVSREHWFRIRAKVGPFRNIVSTSRLICTLSNWTGIVRFSSAMHRCSQHRLKIRDVPRGLGRWPHPNIGLRR